MSDIKLVLNSYGQDMDQDDDDYSKCYETGMLVQTNPDDLLSPLEKVCKYCTSDNIFTRQMVARSIIETVQSIQTRQECLSLLEIITQLSDDVEASVRSELMEQLPPCSLLIMDMRLVPNAISDYILPIMVKYLTGSNNQVRKLTQNALLQLIDQEIITRTEVERQICPVLLTLTEPDSGDDFRTEAVALMTKITPLIGSEAAERSFLERFGDLCVDPLFHVRKVCASNFGDMCSVLPQETTEQQLLPLFARLCEDGVWGVRKACAETFITVSGSCSRQVRYDRLSPLFVGLLCDKSRWVQMAAYQSLGQFISTFAEPEKSGFDVDEDGMLVRCPKIETTTSSIEQDSPLSPLEDPSLESDRQSENRDKVESPSTTTTTSTTTPATETTTDLSATITQPYEDQTFNNFEYWRTPITSIDNLDDIPKEEDTTDSSPASATNTEAPSETNDDTHEDDQRNGAVSPRPSVGRAEDDFMHLDPRGEGLLTDSDDDESNWSLQQDTSNYSSSVVDDGILNTQTIVPPNLLEHFISMTEANKIQTIDGDLAKYCAYTLPGVVLALGPENWHLLKDTYELLSTDMQWKVRRTLAFSIHDLAVILGEEICVNYLLSIFNSFLKDLDEVREGVLQHLYDFINLLPSELQKEYLQLFNEFRTTDNMRKWRFRQDLALQLMSLSTLYTEEELAEHICPVAMELACDNVSEVRQHAFKLLCILIRRINACSDQSLIQKFIASIMELGEKHQHWVKRKSCAQIYLHFIDGQWLDVSQFAAELLPSLIALCSDCVPNIRMITAKALMLFMKTEFYQSLPEDDEVRKSVDHALETLQQDDDRDVRFFSGGKPKERTFSDTAEVDFDQHLMQSGVRMIRRGIHEYTIGNDDEEEDEELDAELVEEVYIDPSLMADSQVDEEYYIEQDADSSLAETTTQYLVEEVVEEVIETIAKPSAPTVELEKEHELSPSSPSSSDSNDDK